MKTEYNFSRDYVQLHELLCDGFIAVGFVNYSFNGSEAAISRDVCKIRRFDAYDIQFGARGIGYGGVSDYLKDTKTELDIFIEECERMELDWINPLNK